MTKITHARALGYLAAELSISGVAREMNRLKSSISELAKKARKVGEERALIWSPGSVRTNLASLAEVRRIIRIVQERPFISSKGIKRLLGGR